jgi:hypothetical protein
LELAFLVIYGKIAILTALRIVQLSAILVSAVVKQRLTLKGIK